MYQQLREFCSQSNFQENKHILVPIKEEITKLSALNSGRKLRIVYINVMKSKYFCILQTFPYLVFKVVIEIFKKSQRKLESHYQNHKLPLKIHENIWQRRFGIGSRVSKVFWRMYYASKLSLRRDTPKTAT